MNYSNNVKKLLSLADEFASDSKVEVMTSIFVESAFVDCDDMYDIISQAIGIEKMPILLSQVATRVLAQKKINPATVEKYEKLRKSLPIRKGQDLFDLMSTAARVSTDRWVTGEIELSHIFLAFFAYGYSESVIVNFFRDNKISPNKIEEIFKNIAAVEADDYGLDDVNTDPIEDHNPLHGATGSEEEAEDSWKSFVTDLVEKVKSYDKPFIGREDVIESTMRILSRRDKCNPVHVGEPGVGKTAITYGLAKKILDGDVPEKLRGAKLYSVDLAGMIAGTKYRGEFEDRLKKLMDGVSKEEKPILFFDEIHTIVGAGATSDSSLDASNIIKPFLTEGKIKFIGATTYNEYRQHIEKDKALERRFQKVDVAEPTIKDCITILDGLKEAYEAYHGVTYSKKAIEAAVNLSAKYINDRYLPDKAIDLVDEAGAYRAIHPELGTKISDKDIEVVLTKICKIPKVNAEKNEMAVARTLEKKLKSKVYGQDDAIVQITDAIKLSKSGLSDGDKPIASFLFVGPSGVGKTEIAKQLSSNLSIDLIRFDMSEYQEKHTVAKLIGAPAGYIGYEDGGLLTEAVRKTPHCVVLFDEIEKAHPDIYKTFLQIMDYGMLTDNKGRKADFRNAIIIMTSNAGATVATKSSAIGFGQSVGGSDVNIDGINSAVEETFPPEFRNRLTKMVVFNGIDDTIGKMIVKKELNALIAKLKSKKINAQFTTECIEQLTRMGVTKEYGARGIQRTINENVKKMFVEAIINEKDLSNCVVDYTGDNFVINNTKKETTKA